MWGTGYFLSHPELTPLAESGICPGAGHYQWAAHRCAASVGSYWQTQYLASVAVWWAVIVGYTMGWSVIAAGIDVTGLWGVGLVILTVSLAVGLGVIAVIAHIVGVRRG